MVDISTRNHAYVWDKGPIETRHVERFAPLPVDGTSFIDTRMQTT